ncbi:hypothetical protein EV200_105361 [Pedobacter psychrotolerans]|uniref:Uncharacterized protein n=1 Tax=Pedobacter psychrotolerans TaxID=1843235 RepID=A0A4R2H9U9_9SPHI|nr:hypothetical protein EV200_105361 [Pedobacter psychrotolerans]
MKSIPNKKYDYLSVGSGTFEVTFYHEMIS